MDLSALLRQWNTKLLSRLQGLSTSQRLEQRSQKLVEFSSSTVEVPGQYVTDMAPLPSAHAKIHCFQRDVQVMFRQGFAQRRITITGNDGWPYRFLVQFCAPHATRTDERTSQLCVAVNQLLQTSNQARSRKLVIDFPVVIPLTPRMRLFEDHGCYVSLADVLDSDLKRKGMNCDSLSFKHRMQLCDAPPADVDGQALQAFKSVCDDIVPDSVLSYYVAQTLTSPDCLAVFKYRFAHQMALTAFMSYIMGVGDRTPQRVRAASVVVCMPSLRFDESSWRPLWLLLLLRKRSCCCRGHRATC